MMATCMGLRRREEPDHPLRLAASLWRRDIGIAWPFWRRLPLPPLLLPRQPGPQEGKLGSIAAGAHRRAHFRVSLPLERGTTEVVGLEGKQPDDRHAQPAEQGLHL